MKLDIYLCLCLAPDASLGITSLIFSDIIFCEFKANGPFFTPYVTCKFIVWGNNMLPSIKQNLFYILKEMFNPFPTAWYFICWDLYWLRIFLYQTINSPSVLNTEWSYKISTALAPLSLKKKAVALAQRRPNNEWYNTLCCGNYGYIIFFLV